MNQQLLKFRVWDIANKVMRPVLVLSFGEDGEGKEIVASWLDPEGMGHSWIHGQTGVVMQYTGLMDRDGTEICNGDIVSWDGGSYPVEYYAGGFRFLPFKPPHDHMWLSTADETDLKIVGTVYENPELLKS